MGFFDVMKRRPVDLGSGQQFPVFNRVSIETHSKCNRRCGFCPVSTGRRDYSKSMTDETFGRVVDALRAIDFDGVAQMFLLNEPFIDPRFLERVRAVKDACPRCSTYVSTNGDPISKSRDPIAKLVEAFDAGVNVINLNVYDSGHEQRERYRKLIDDAVAAGVCREITEGKYRHHSPRTRAIYLTDMRLERIDASKVDMFYDKKKEVRPRSVPQTYCARPHRHIVVMWNGDVPLCCAIDPTMDDAVIVGNVNATPLLDIWQCDEMNKYRWYLQNKQRRLPNCDTCMHRMSYSHVVRKVQPSQEQLERWGADLASYEDAKSRQQSSATVALTIKES